MVEASQKKLFIEREGDGWYGRNTIAGEALDRSIATDPVLRAVRRIDLKPRRMLEIGASNGWRMHALKEIIPGLSCSGVEPSAKAVKEAYPGLDMHQGTADSLPFAGESFDLVVFGFCLYLCDRRDLFRIAAEADRVLEESGYMIVYDFSPPVSYKNPYSHAPGAFSYKMDHSRLFVWNPAYRTVFQQSQPHPGYEDKTGPDYRVAVNVLQKNSDEGWPDNPYKDRR